MKIEMDISREILENIFVTALEGGSNYWYFVNEENHSKMRNAVPPEEERAFSMAFFKAVYDKGISIDLHDVEDSGEWLGTISKATMLTRLESLLNNDDYKWALLAEIDGHGDAETSDVVFQYLTMEDVIYA